MAQNFRASHSQISHLRGQVYQHCGKCCPRCVLLRIASPEHTKQARLRNLATAQMLNGHAQHVMGSVRGYRGTGGNWVGGGTGATMAAGGVGTNSGNRSRMSTISVQQREMYGSVHSRSSSGEENTIGPMAVAAALVERNATAAMGVAAVNPTRRFHTNLATQNEESSLATADAAACSTSSPPLANNLEIDEIDRVHEGDEDEDEVYDRAEPLAPQEHYRTICATSGRPQCARGGKPRGSLVAALGRLESPLAFLGWRSKSSDPIALVKLPPTSQANTTGLTPLNLPTSCATTITTSNNNNNNNKVNNANTRTDAVHRSPVRSASFNRQASAEEWESDDSSMRHVKSLERVSPQYTPIKQTTV